MPKTVLLADDSVTIQHAVGISLANEDIALVNVNNGEDAVIKARAMKPDLIILDVVMPKLSGYEACKQIRQDPMIRHTPVIMLVGAIEGFDERKFKESMANDYIIKPFESGALISKVRKYLYPEMMRGVGGVQGAGIGTGSVVGGGVVSQGIPIPPKPAVPPVVPPVVSNVIINPPSAPASASTVTSSVSSAVEQGKVGSVVSQEGVGEKVAPVVPNFTENLVTSVVGGVKEEVRDEVDEISPQEIEEITSGIVGVEGKEEKVVGSGVSVIDIVGQVEKVVSGGGEVEGGGKGFDMEEWGKELKKEIMEASGVSERAEVVEGVSEKVEEGKVEATVEGIPISTSVEVQGPMEVVSIAESISTEPVGEPVKGVEVPAVETPIPAEVEPTSLVEKKIELGTPLTEETVKQVREIVERVVWEVVPELAEKLIKEEIKRLMSETEE